ncbi:MAG TPA: hypothetical protein VGL68_05780 [Solirubrobacteraceae bacterium]
MRPRLRRAAPTRVETWLWTGPVGHLVGGGLDFLAAFARYVRARRARAKGKRDS